MICQKSNHSQQPYCRCHLPHCDVRQGGGRTINRDGHRRSCPGADKGHRLIDWHMDLDHSIAGPGTERYDQPKHDYKPCIVTACYRITLCQKRGYCHVKKCKRRHGNRACRQRNQETLHIIPSVPWPILTAHQCPCQ